MFTVVTVSIPERHELLARACESVRSQSYGPVPHLIRIDEPGDRLSTQHVAQQRNAIIKAVDTPYMAVLDDDDTFEPTYLERINDALLADCDTPHDWPPAVIYTYCHGHPHAEGEFDGERLQRENFIDGEAVISTYWLHKAGSYPVNDIVEDWQVYKRIHELGGRFVCIPERLRFHGRAPRNITG